MELSVTQFVTIDGVYQAPGGPSEDPSGGFAHGGWSAPFGDDAFGEFMVSVFDRVDAFLLGRKTYEIFASYWPNHNLPGHPIANKLNDLPKYVPTSTLDHADWSGTELLHGDPLKEIAELKARPGRELQVHGSGCAHPLATGRRPRRHPEHPDLPGHSRHGQATVPGECRPHRVHGGGNPGHPEGRGHRDLPQAGCPDLRRLRRGLSRTQENRLREKDSRRAGFARFGLTPTSPGAPGSDASAARSSAARCRSRCRR